MCGREKHEFELKGDGWNKHIQTENNIWAYLGFVIYIKKKPITECNGIEKYVKTKLLQNDISFFPSSALCLEEDVDRKVDIRTLILKNLKEIEHKLMTHLQK